jgi:vacuolar-type H+-ATPase subunit I/STV1
MEMQHDSFVGQSALSEDLESKMRDSQARLLQLQSERDEIERQAREWEELNSKKKVFLSGQVEVTEKLGNAVTLIDRELLAMRKELHELEQCRQAFDNSLRKISKYDPESWSRENLKLNLEKAISVIDHAAEEYEQAAYHFASMRSGEIFGHVKKGRKGGIHPDGGDFLADMKSGLAFNLPIITFGALALAIYILK